MSRIKQRFIFIQIVPLNVCYMFRPVLRPSSGILYYISFIRFLIDTLRWSRGSVLAFSTQVRGLKPGRSGRMFRTKKILSTPSFGGEVKPSVPCRRFAAYERSLNLSGSRNLGKITEQFLAHSSTFRCYDLSRRCGRTGTWRRK